MMVPDVFINLFNATNGKSDQVILTNAKRKYIHIKLLFLNMALQLNLRRIKAMNPDTIRIVWKVDSMRFPSSTDELYPM